MAQSHGNTFIKLTVISNSGFAIGISLLSVIILEIKYFRFSWPYRYFLGLERYWYWDIGYWAILAVLGHIDIGPIFFCG